MFDWVTTTPEEQYGPELLSDITKVTGGESFTVWNLNDLPDVAMKIRPSERVHHRVSSLSEAHDGKWHKIRVKLLPPKGLL